LAQQNEIALKLKRRMMRAIDGAVSASDVIAS